MSRRAASRTTLEAELRTWKSKFEQTEQLARLGCWEVDLDSGELTWSEGTYQIFGVAPGCPITVGQALAFYDAPTQILINQHLSDARDAGTAFDLTIPFQRRDGRSGWVRMLGKVTGGHGPKRLAGVIKDVTEERAAEEKLRRLAHHDSLTGLSNRHAFHDELSKLLQARRVRSGFALVRVDVDHFKAVNDAHGHAAGGALLRDVAHRLESSIGTTDLVARLGGDQFAIIFQDILCPEDIARRVDGVREAVRQVWCWDAQTVEPTLSIGVAVQAPGETNADEMIRQADLALDRAKLEERDKACLVRPKHREEADPHHTLISEITRALARDELVAFYQPIVDLRTQIVRGWEALVRWRHPEKGLLSPAAFLPALLDPRTSVAIDELVLTRSLGQMRAWLDAGVPVTCAGVNVSEAQLKRPDLVPLIQRLLARYDLTPDRLKIEVLETAFVGHSPKLVAATIEELARFGVVSILDDFGTGFASLTHLKQFKVERIKIDRSFISNIVSDRQDRAIVKSMIGLGRNLGIRVTAEGIETVEQLRVLQDFDCDCGQGYLFGRPMPPEDVPAFLDRWEGGRSADLLSLERV